MRARRWSEQRGAGVSTGAGLRWWRRVRGHRRVDRLSRRAGLGHFGVLDVFRFRRPAVGVVSGPVRVVGLNGVLVEGISVVDGIRSAELIARRAEQTTDRVDDPAGQPEEAFAAAAEPTAQVTPWHSGGVTERGSPIRLRRGRKRSRRERRRGWRRIHRRARGYGRGRDRGRRCAGRGRPANGW